MEQSTDYTSCDDKLYFLRRQTILPRATKYYFHARPSTTSTRDQVLLPRTTKYYFLARRGIDCYFLRKNAIKMFLNYAVKKFLLEVSGYIASKNFERLSISLNSYILALPTPRLRSRLRPSRTFFIIVATSSF